MPVVVSLGGRRDRPASDARTARLAGSASIVPNDPEQAVEVEASIES
jgi:hypothetical protein